MNTTDPSRDETEYWREKALKTLADAIYCIRHHSQRPDGGERIRELTEAISDIPGILRGELRGRSSITRVEGRIEQASAIMREMGGLGEFAPAKTKRGVLNFIVEGIWKGRRVGA